MAKKQHKILLWAVFLSSFSSFSAEEEKVVKEPWPVGSDFYLSQSVGAKAPFKAEQAPYVNSSLYVYPYYKSKPFWGERRIKTSVELHATFDWLSDGKSFVNPAGERFNFLDVKVRSEFQNALKFGDIGLSISPGLEIETPTSKAALKSNRIAGIGGYINFNWSKWGFFAKYRPVALGYVHTDTFKSGQCSETSTEADKLGGNACKLSGRQTMVLLKNGVFLGYNFEAHAITAGMRVNHTFLRAPGQGEKESSGDADVMESSVAMLEYGYTFPIQIPFSLAAGVSSSQDYYPVKEGFRVPFFSLVEPSKNETEFYLAMNLSI